MHANAAGTATRRMGRDCLPFTPEQQREILVAKGQIDYSADPTEAREQDLSGVEIDRARRLLRAAGLDDLVVRH